MTQPAVDSADPGLYLDEMNVASKPSWMFRAPRPAAILAFLEPLRASELLPFSYLEVGASRHNAERVRLHDDDLSHANWRIRGRNPRPR